MGKCPCLSVVTLALNKYNTCLVLKSLEKIDNIN